MSNIGEYFIGLYKFSSNELYKELIKLLDETIDLAIKQYIIGSDKEEYEFKYSVLINEVTQYVQKIEAVLEFLIISDPSQTNKFNLEECLTYNIPTTVFNSLVINLNNSIDECDINLKTVKECSDLVSNENISLYKELIEKKLNFILKEKIFTFNIFINNYIKCIIKIKTVLKKFSTSTSSLTDY